MLERKYMPLADSEMKFATGKHGQFEGYASVFNGVDSYGDTVAPGAYAKTLQSRQRPVQMRWNHFGPVIGKWTDIHEDEKGLRVVGELTPGHSVAEDAYALLKHGAVNGLSIGFRLPKDGFTKTKSGRLLKSIDLVEISVVESPADLRAQVGGVKSAVDDAETLADIERALREVSGFTRAEACLLVSRVKSLIQSESESEPNQSDSDADKAALIRRAFQRIRLSNHFGV